jgi:pimeloyl-ACP methyl ester carboxylesterase
MTDAVPAHDNAYFAGLGGALTGEAADRTPLVFLHGLTFDSRIWDPILEGLRRVDENRQVLTLDLPGHGRSPRQLPHSYRHVTALIHDAVVETGLKAPVLVGHSISGGLASIYAAHYPTSGVVNIDAPPDLAGVATMLQSVADKIRGPEFAQVWGMLQDSFRLDLLPPHARALVETNCNPRQDVAVSYWEELLDTPPNELEAALFTDMRALAAADVPYLLLAGSVLSPTADEAMRLVPNAQVEVWADAGHFPQFAHPERFLDRLVATASWRAGSPAARSVARA